MPKFIYIYRGPTPDLTPEQGAERLAAFTAWVANAGDALLDVGHPFGAGVAIFGDGEERAASELIGYSVVQAESLAAAKELTGGLPLLADGEETSAVEVFELVEM